MVSRLDPWKKLILAACLFPASCSKEQPNAQASDSASASASPSASAIASASASASASANASDVTSSASPSHADDGPAITTDGSVDGAALRAKNHARLAADHSAVTLLQGDDPLTLGRRICEASVPKRAPDTPILIKPNIGGFEWFRDAAKNGGDDGLQGRITQPEFVRGIVKCLKARGHTKITIAEGWGASHKDWEHLVAASGYEAMAKEENVPLVAMDDDGVFDVQGDKPGKPLKVNGMEKTSMATLLMPKILAEHLAHGLFISAPKLKVHRFGVVSIGIKGMQGLVMTSDASPAFHQKWRSHRELSAALTAGAHHDPDARAQYVKSLDLFAERMVDMLEVAAPDVVLADGAPAEGGDGFGRRVPVKEHVALGGTNPILVDRVGAEFLGLWKNDALAKELLGHATSPLIEAAGKRFGVDIASPRVEGDGAPLLATKRPAHLFGMAGFTIDDDGATGGYVTDGGAPSSGRPELTAARASAPPAIDGDTSDDAWKRAQPVSFVTDYAGNATATKTTVRALWSDALYLAIDLESAGFNVDTSKPVTVERTKLYEEDCAEIFLAPDPKNRDRYFEMEVGPRGHFFDIDVDHAKKTSDTAWSAKMTIAARADEAAHVAHLEIAVRAPEIVATLVPNARLPLGLYRIEGKSPRTYLAWSPPRTDKPNFHVPSAFGTLVLAP
jgi:uncharacterized protein (DUF362 family)